MHLLPVLALAAFAVATAALSSDSSSKCPTFLQRVSHAGCILHVWRGADDRLWVEPTFCVPDPKLWLSDAAVCARRDPVGGYSYVNVPLMLTNRTLLSGLAAQLSHLRPSSVKYVGFEDIQVAKITDRPLGAKVQELRFEPREFIWSQSEDLGMLRLGCEDVACSVLEHMVREGRWEQLLEPLMATFSLKWPPCGKVGQRQARQKAAIAVQDAPYHPLWSLVRDVGGLPECANISAEVETQEVAIGNASCHLRLHRESGAVRLHAEPLLCYAEDARVVHDFNRGLHFIILKLLLRSDPAKLGAAASSPVTFMRLLDPGLSEREAARWDLQLAADGDSMLMRVPCDAGTDYATACAELLSAIQSDPLVIFSRIKWRPTAWISESAAGPGCRFAITESRLTIPLTLSRRPPAAAAPAGCPAASRFSCGAVRCQYVRLADGRSFLVAQQRRSASVKFARNWTDYEAGFGDEHNFWIGLKNIDALTRPRGSLLRIEAKLWNGSELYAEYSRMRLEGSRYNLTYGRYLRHRSNLGLVDPLAPSRNAVFSTADRLDPLVPWGAVFHYYDYRFGSQHRSNPTLSQLGSAGWWWSSAAISQVGFNPNGIFHYGETLPAGDKRAFVGLNLTYADCGGRSSERRRDEADPLEWKFLKEVRFMLEV